MYITVACAQEGEGARAGRVWSREDEGSFGAR